MSLTEQCIQSINSIQTEIDNAQVAIGAAMSEAYAKHSELIQMGAECIMEGDFWTPNKEDGESIFKTIFLFIPRLIYNLVQLIKNKFNDLKLKAMSPELREWVRFHNLSGGEQLVETVNDPDFIGTPNKEDKSKEAVEMDFFIMTYIKDFKAIYDYYDKMLQCFQLYEDCMKSNPTDCSAAFTGVDVALDELNHKDFDEVFARHKIAQPYENCSAFRKAIENIKTKSIVRLDQIAKSMREIQDWYEKLDASGRKTASDEVKARAREFIKSVKDRYKMIQDTSTKIIDEIDRLIHLEFKIEESIAVLRVQHKAISSQNKSKKRGK